MARINQRTLTSIGGLIVIALIAAGLIIAVVVFVKQRGDQVRRDEAVKIADQQAAEQEATNEANNADVDDETVSEGATTDPDESTATDGEETAPVLAATDELPATGPSDGLVQLLAVAALGLATSFYVASRRAVAEAR